MKKNKEEFLVIKNENCKNSNEMEKVIDTSHFLGELLECNDVKYVKNKEECQVKKIEAIVQKERPIPSNLHINRFRNKKNLSTNEFLGIPDSLVQSAYANMTSRRRFEREPVLPNLWKTLLMINCAKGLDIYGDSVDYCEVPIEVYNFALELVVRNRDFFHYAYVSFELMENIIEYALTMFTQNEINSILNLLNHSYIKEFYEGEHIELLYPYVQKLPAFPSYDFHINNAVNFFISEFISLYVHGANYIYNHKKKLNDFNYPFTSNDFIRSMISEENMKLYSPYSINLIAINLKTVQLERSVRFTVYMRRNQDDTITMGYDTFILIADDTIKVRGKILYRIKYLKDITYIVDGVTYSVKKGDLGGYVSSLAFVQENVIIYPNAKIMANVLISAGVIIDNDVTLYGGTIIYKHCFKVDTTNVDLFKKEPFRLAKSTVEFMQKRKISLPFIKTEATKIKNRDPELIEEKVKIEVTQLKLNL